MAEERTGRSWSVLLLEMVLIVTSILLAFSLESWRNGREELDQQERARQTVLEDLRTAGPQLQAYIAQGDSLLARKLRLLEALADPRSAGIDSLQALFEANSRPIVRIPVPPSLALASGELQTLQRPALMAALARVDFADQMLSEHMRVSADIFYTGPEAAVVARLGSSNVLSGGPRVPPRFSPSDYVQVVSAPDVYAAAERMVIVSRNVLSGLRQLDDALGDVVSALEARPYQ